MPRLRSIKNILYQGVLIKGQTITGMFDKLWFWRNSGKWLWMRFEIIKITS